jgi:hypothetical protein
MGPNVQTALTQTRSLTIRFESTARSPTWTTSLLTQTTSATTLHLLNPHGYHRASDTNLNCDRFEFLLTRLVKDNYTHLRVLKLADLDITPDASRPRLSSWVRRCGPLTPRVLRS